MTRPRLLDLFCGAGGAAMGYHEAGFEVVGVDIKPQPRYPFKFAQTDALEVLEEWSPDSEFDAIHASPPCQAFTAYKRTGNVGEYPDLIAATRELLEATGLPWVIENVEGAPLNDPLLLCGSMFDLDVKRHRLFEFGQPYEHPLWGCRHKIWGPDRFPGGRSKERTGSSRGLVRGTIEIGSWDIPIERQREAMGIDWPMTVEEISEAIPPVYTELIGHQLMAYLRAVAA
jgi:DNA (cytosine-5)-methyltransferase 1